MWASLIQLHPLPAALHEAPDKRTHIHFLLLVLGGGRLDSTETMKFQRQGLTMDPRLTSNSQCCLGWPVIARLILTPPCLDSSRVYKCLCANICHHSQLKLVLKNPPQEELDCIWCGGGGDVFSESDVEVVALALD